MKKLVWLYGADPGAANVLFPLANFLVEKGYAVEIYGEEAALTVFEKRKVAHKEAFFSTKKDILRLLEEDKPDYILTGTSANGYRERLLWKVAKERGIYTMAILDQWMNYGLRFSNLGSARADCYIPHQTTLILPDKICVMDKEAYEEAMRDGLPEEKLFITGHPYLFWLKHQRIFPNNRRPKEGPLRIVFASEPLTEDYAHVRGGAKEFLGYDEKIILKGLIEALHLLSHSIKLSIRLHPRERNGEKFKDILEGVHFPYEWDEKADHLETIYSSDLVVGMSSMFLIEAHMLGKPVLSLQYDCKKDLLMLSKRGEVPCVIQKEETKAALESMVGATPPQKEWQGPSAMEKIYALMEG